MPSAWRRCAGARRVTRRSCTPTMARSIRPGRSGNGFAPPGVLPSMGTVGDCYDNSMMESFWGTMQLKLLDSKMWETREQANAIFERSSMLVQHRTAAFQHPNAQPDPVRSTPPRATVHRG